MSTTAVPGAATISVPEAGRILGVSRQTAYLAVARGDIPSIRVGGRILVPRRRLAALLAGEVQPSRDVAAVD